MSDSEEKVEMAFEPGESDDVEIVALKEERQNSQLKKRRKNRRRFSSQRKSTRLCCPGGTPGLL